MPKTSSWLESMKDWGPKSFQEVEDLGVENSPQYDPYEDEAQKTIISPASRKASTHARDG